ncbi:MAG TPA: hypothetical protein VFM37_03650 [Pseudonocardiaceae bacterium]|nr:hypothetical protein [Pseudonocardiaceae bacterium]
MPEAEIRSFGFCTFSQVRERVKPLLAGRIAAALESIEQGVTAPCDHGCRIA